MKSLRLKSQLGKNVVDFFVAILVNSDPLDIDEAFKINNFGYRNHIFEDTSDSRFYIGEIQKHKKVTQFNKELLVLDEDIMQSEDLITYYKLVQEDAH